MTRFAELQSSFQRAILERDSAVLSALVPGPKEPLDAMLGVYQHAYGARLVEAMSKEHELLHTFLGDDTFAEMGASYLATHPSHHANVRWVSRHLPAFLRETEPYRDYPVVAELAAFEKALNDAFDAADGRVLTGTDLAEVPADGWHDLVLTPHPSACRLSLATNAVAVWTALRAEVDPPTVETLPAPNEMIVWRDDTTPMFRAMEREEAMMWDEASAGVPFGQLCVMLATFDDPDNAAGRAAGYLGNWVGAGMLAAATRV